MLRIGDTLVVSGMEKTGLIAPLVLLSTMRMGDVVAWGIDPGGKVRRGRQAKKMRDVVRTGGMVHWRLRSP